MDSIAAHMGNQKFVKLLLEKGNSPCIFKEQRRFICFSHCGQGKQSCSNGRTRGSMSRYLRVVGQQGSDGSSCCCTKWKVWSIQLFPGETRSLKFFFDEQDKEGNTLVHLAAINDQVLLSSYLKYGRFVDLNVMDKEGFTTTDNALLRWKLNSLTVWLFCPALQLTRIKLPN